MKDLYDINVKNVFVDSLYDMGLGPLKKLFKEFDVNSAVFTHTNKITGTMMKFVCPLKADSIENAFWIFLIEIKCTSINCFEIIPRMETIELTF